MGTIYLNVGSVLKDSVVDGPGLRHVLFLAGCYHDPHCEGCHNPELWDKENGTKVSLFELKNILHDYIDGLVGLTISGGEPLHQYKKLCILLRILKLKRYNATRFEKDIPASDVILYTRYTFAEVKARFPEILPLVDIVIDGPYEKDLPPAKWRGSDNQRIYQKQGKRWLLTEL